MLEFVIKPHSAKLVIMLEIVKNGAYQFFFYVLAGCINFDLPFIFWPSTY